MFSVNRIKMYIKVNNFYKLCKCFKLSQICTNIYIFREALYFLSKPIKKKFYKLSKILIKEYIFFFLTISKNQLLSNNISTNSEMNFNELKLTLR